MSEMNFTVDPGKCTGCETCVRDCPSASLAMLDGTPVVARFGEKSCIKCQHCLAVCPEGAVSIFGKNPEDCGTVKTLPQPEEVASLYQFRRSCRQYKHKTIAKSKLDALLGMLRWTPTGHNDRGLHFSVVDDVGAMDGIRSFIGSALLQMVHTDTLPPAFRWVKMRRSNLEQGADIVFANAPHIIVASVRDDSLCKEIDPIIALAQFETMAQSFGLGTTWCGFAYWVFQLFEKDARKLLRIPEGHSIAYVMLFGEPDVEYPRSTSQEPPGITLISETHAANQGGSNDR